jgi:membrane protein
MKAVGWRQSEITDKRRVTGGRGPVGLIRDALRGCIEHRVVEMAAATSYYAALSLAPLLVIAVAITGAVFGGANARREIGDRFESMVGEQGSQLVVSLIDNASRPHAGLVATVIGIAMLIAAAGGASGQLNESLDRIWEVGREPGTAWARFLRRRILSFALVVVFALLLLASLASSVALAGLGSWTSEVTPAWSLRLLDITVSFGMITVLAALIFRFLPSARIAWRDVWTGAVITSALFALGNSLIGLYFGRASLGSVYGAAGSFTVLLIWVYCSTLNILFGTEITRAHAMRSARNA